MKKIISFLKKNKAIIFQWFLFAFMLLIVMVVFNKTSTKNFFLSMELKSFDLRQMIIAEHKKTNKDIVIVTVDDASYEYLLNHYGEWPVPRGVYADFVNYVEAQKPTVVAFDLLFLKSFRSSIESDRQLVKVFKKYDNLYTAMNFDDQPIEIRTPVELPAKLKSNVKIESPIFRPYVFQNCRSIMNDIMSVTSNIGQINTVKSDDGVNRLAPLIVGYPEYDRAALKSGEMKPIKTDLYPYMTLKVAQRYLKDKEGIDTDKLVVDKDNNLLMGNRKIPMFPDSQVVLNWYGESGLKANKTFTYVPFWKVLETMNGNTHNSLPKDYFKGKVVYFGTSVVSLSDIKVVPTEKYLPGVELHATLLNNIIDNSIIKAFSPTFNIAITMVVSVLVGLVVYFTASIFTSLLAAMAIILTYLVIATYGMYYFNIWLWVASPIGGSILAFILAYIVKYIVKSRDFEYTYKLATTDGLTELYNHRFFQEQMIMNIDYSKRSGQKFSLILIDIDFFKKFNDTYGHQAGDAVLKQVAQTLKKTVRSSDIVCRYGGEEMSIILRDTDKEEAKITAQKVCDAVANRMFKLGPNLERHVTISLGVSTYPENGITPTELIEFADKGLYSAKENGRNQVGCID
ncbi:MAG: diguanylate cyclase [Candidatus Gastranaerophilales bacterium]|nr:diguanylate cyclase [Candidatus Gastranaerophilales bacterium]